MKTIEEHFIDSMPADIAAMAIANTEDSLLELKSYKTPEAALQHAFTWCNSKQGNLFWSQVFDTLQAEGDFRDHRCHTLQAKEGRMIDTPRTYKLIDTEVKNDLINEIIDIWRNQYQGLALGRLWMLDELIAELEKDKARLDWMLNASADELNSLSGWNRQEIDAAMEADNE